MFFKRSFLLILTILVFLLSACAPAPHAVDDATASNSSSGSDMAEESTDPEETKITYEEPSDVVYYTRVAERYETFDTVEALDENSDNIIVGKCLSTKTLFKDHGFMYTASEVLITSTYKGDIEPDSTITVIEFGGTCTAKEFIENSGITEKDFYDASAIEIDDKLIVASGIDGYYPMNAGNESLLFLGSAGTFEGVEGEIYGVAGSSDGKLYKISDTKFARPLPNNVSGGYSKGYSLQSSLDNSDLVIDISELPVTE